MSHKIFYPTKKQNSDHLAEIKRVIANGIQTRSLKEAPGFDLMAYLEGKMNETKAAKPAPERDTTMPGILQDAFRSAANPLGRIGILDGIIQVNQNRGKR